MVAFERSVDLDLVARAAASSQAPPADLAQGVALGRSSRLPAVCTALAIVLVELAWLGLLLYLLVLLVRA